MPSRRIEGLTFDGCPNAKAAEALVEPEVADLGAEAGVVSVRVPDVDATERLRFLGSLPFCVEGRVSSRCGRRTDYALA